MALTVTRVPGPNLSSWDLQVLRVCVFSPTKDPADSVGQLVMLPGVGFFPQQQLCMHF